MSTAVSAGASVKAENKRGQYIIWLILGVPFDVRDACGTVVESYHQGVPLSRRNWRDVLVGKCGLDSEAAAAAERLLEVFRESHLPKRLAWQDGE